MKTPPPSRVLTLLFGIDALDRYRSFQIFRFIQHMLKFDPVLAVLFQSCAVKESKWQIDGKIPGVIEGHAGFGIWAFFFTVDALYRRSLESPILDPVK